MARPLPGLDAPIVDPKTGQMTQVWWEFFSSRVGFTQFPDVSTVAPTNGQVLIYNSTTKLWTPGAN